MSVDGIQLKAWIANNNQPEVYSIHWPFKNPLYVSEGLYEGLPIGIVLCNEQFQLSFCNSKHYMNYAKDANISDAILAKFINLDCISYKSENQTPWYTVYWSGQLLQNNLRWWPDLFPTPHSLYGAMFLELSSVQRRRGSSGTGGGSRSDFQSHHSPLSLASISQLRSINVSKFPTKVICVKLEMELLLPRKQSPSQLRYGRAWHYQGARLFPQSYRPTIPVLDQLGE